MKRVFFAGIIPLTLTVLVVIGWWLIQSTQFDVLNPSGDIALQQRRILFFTLSLAAIVVVPVFVMLISFAWRYRAGNKKAKYRPEWDKNHWLEIIWWGVPIIIISTLAVVTWQSSHSLDPYRALESDKKPVEVQVVALQWKWLFIYPELGVATVNHLPIPEKTPIHFTLTADAPMSAFWVPSLGSQIYTMNGMKSQLHLIANHTGSFEGYNTNINGKGYSSMKFMVEAKTGAEFDKWVQSTKKQSPTLDQITYEKLAKQDVMKQSMAYGSVDTGLFDTIVNKYMSGHTMPAPSASEKPKQSQPEMRHDEHAGHHMEGH